MQSGKANGTSGPAALSRELLGQTAEASAEPGDECTEAQMADSGEGRASATVESAKRTAHKRTAPANRRQTFLGKRATTLGMEWAKAWREELHKQGRPAAGAWPGTMSEARARVDQFIMPELIRRGMRSATDDERAEAVRIAYNSAKVHWNEHRDRDPSEA